MRAAVLFSGIGGWEIACRNNGVPVAWAAEWDDWKRERYSERWPNAILYRDVADLDGGELVDRHGPVDLLLASPPCTDISAATPPEPVSMATSHATISRPSDLHGRPALVGSDLRTHLGSALAELTGCSPSWKRPGTPSGRAWWKLRMPALRTREDVPMFSDAGGMQSKVPTPSAVDYGSNRGGAAGRTGPERPSLKRMLTPTAKDNLTAPSMVEKWPGARELMAVPASATEKLPTCTASSGGPEPDGATGRKLVTVMRRRLATPTARDWRSGKASAATLSKNSRPLNEQLCALGITEATALLAIYLWLMAWPRDYADTAYPSAPSKPSSRAGARRSGTRS